MRSYELMQNMIDEDLSLLWMSGTYIHTVHTYTFLLKRCMHACIHTYIQVPTVDQNRWFFGQLPFPLSRSDPLPNRTSAEVTTIHTCIQTYIHGWMKCLSLCMYEVHTQAWSVCIYVYVYDHILHLLTNSAVSVPQGEAREVPRKPIREESGLLGQNSHLPG